MKHVAIFASGNGTNAEAIIRHFKSNDSVKISLILSNKKDAYVLERAQNHGIDTYVTERSEFYGEDGILPLLRSYNIDLIVLAGFLWLIPQYLVDAYEGKIINIHPALLPRYGGKGMYGMKVHEAVKAAGDKETGITIHMVNERYDEGDIVFQAKCEVDANDTPEEIAASVHKLEYEYYPLIIESILKNQ